MKARPLPVSGLEIGLLTALAFFLPLLEVPKQLTWFAWVLVSLWMMRGGRQPVGPWRWCMLALLITALLAGLGAPHAPREMPAEAWRQAFGWLFASRLGQTLAGAGDTLRLVSVVWLMACRGYRPSDGLPVLVAAVLGTVVATLWGFWRLYSADTLVFLELHSVGHVNQSSIYLAIALGIAVGIGFAAPTRFSRGRVLALSAALFMAVALLAAASRAAVAAALVFLLLLAAFAPFPMARAPRLRWRLRAAVLLVAIGSVLAYALVSGLSDRKLQPPGQGLLEKFGFQSGQGAPVSHRDGLTRLALAIARTYPFFGVGVGDFRRVDARRYCAELAPQTRSATAPSAMVAPSAPAACDVSRVYFSFHAHSLFMNTLAERGLLGLGVVVLLLIAWAWRLRMTLGWARESGHASAIWSASLAGLSITALAGLLNTTLHHEHGLLAMLSLGLLLSASRHRADA